MCDDLSVHAHSHKQWTFSGGRRLQFFLAFLLIIATEGPGRVGARSGLGPIWALMGPQVSDKNLQSQLCICLLSGNLLMYCYKRYLKLNISTKMFMKYVKASTAMETESASIAFEWYMMQTVT